MNIFILHSDPVVAAEQMCDKHIVKMILETAQLLCSPFPNGTAPYKVTHYNHPCAIWTRQSLENYDWLIQHGRALNAQYMLRYKSNKPHKSLSVIEWCNNNKHTLNFPTTGLTTFCQAIPDDCKDRDPITAYRNYYIRYKNKIAKWKLSSVPDWWLNAQK